MISGPCEIQPQRDGSSLLYSSAVNWEAGIPNSIISRSRMFSVEFECLFEMSYTLSLDNGITPLVEKAKIDIGRVEREIDVALGLWESEMFQKPLPADAEIIIPEKLHVAAVIDQDAAFNVELDECWATPRFDSWLYVAS